MSRRRAARNSDKLEVDECIAIMETTITDAGKKKQHQGRRQQQQQQQQSLSQLWLWPVRLVSSLCSRLNVELERLVIDEKNQAVDNDEEAQCNYLPSLAAFFLGLTLVRTYSDYIDNVIRACLEGLIRASLGLYELLSGLTCEELEICATACVIVLFWIGAARIVGNVLAKLIEAPKFPACNYAT